MRNIKYILLSALLLLSLAIQAETEQRGRPNVKEMHERKWQFMMNEVELSPAEINAVKPVFLNYEKAIWELHEKDREFFRLSRERKQGAEINYSELNDKAVNSEISHALLLKNYHLKLRKLLKPETLFNYYQAERKFKRKLLQNMPKNMPPPPPEYDR
ncbi:MAG TPA: hypothetical protein PK664_07925 [Paludibacteraceae bacterium]|mgnify:CR=1 FL=1|nr:hypothetical protein [Paludibacteraceae bacterium]